ncbi:hypothetical protein GCM10022219_20760 [Microbacterium oryzae]
MAGRQIALTGRMVVVSGRGEIAAGDADMDRDVSVRTGHGNLRGVGPLPAILGEDEQGLRLSPLPGELVDSAHAASLPRTADRTRRRLPHGLTAPSHDRPCRDEVMPQV